MDTFQEYWTLKHDTATFVGKEGVRDKYGKVRRARVIIFGTRLLENIVDACVEVYSSGNNFWQENGLIVSCWYLKLLQKNSKWVEQNEAIIPIRRLIYSKTTVGNSKLLF